MPSVNRRAIATCEVMCSKVLFKTPKYIGLSPSNMKLGYTDTATWWHA